MLIDGQALSFMVTASGHGSISKIGLRPDLHRRSVQLSSIDNARTNRSHKIGLLSTMLSFPDLSGKPKSKRCRPSCKPRSNGQTAPSTSANHTIPTRQTPPHSTPYRRHRDQQPHNAGPAAAHIKGEKIKEARWRSAYRGVRDQ
jgi:hypothetical protein